MGHVLTALVKLDLPPCAAALLVDVYADTTGRAAGREVKCGVAAQQSVPVALWPCSGSIVQQMLHLGWVGTADCLQQHSGFWLTCRGMNGLRWQDQVLQLACM